MRFTLLKLSDPFFVEERNIKTLKELASMREFYDAPIEVLFDIQAKQPMVIIKDGKADKK